MAENIPPGKDGGPAFPETRWSDEHRAEIQWSGMSLRDFFAATVMSEQCKFSVSDNELKQQATRCYAIADAMIAEGQKLKK